jgi:heme A synthase
MSEPTFRSLDIVLQVIGVLAFATIVSISAVALWRVRSQNTPMKKGSTVPFALAVALLLVGVLTAIVAWGSAVAFF